jgi:hypothetical protein
MRRIPLAVLISIAVASTAFAGGPEHDGDHHGDISKVNRSVSVENGGRAGDVESVNGSVTIGDDAIVETAETVNGSVRIGANSQAESLETINGSIGVGAKTVVSDGIETVNGAITLAADAASLGKIETVNGRIELGDRAQAGDGIELVNGDVELKSAARVRGDIVVRKPSGNGWFNKNNKTPRVILGPNAVVDGNLVFEREVELYMHETAKLNGQQNGPLAGGKVNRFSGSAPAL